MIGVPVAVASLTSRNRVSSGPCTRSINCWEWARGSASQRAARSSSSFSSWRRSASVAPRCNIRREAVAASTTSRMTVIAVKGGGEPGTGLGRNSCIALDQAIHRASPGVQAAAGAFDCQQDLTINALARSPHQVENRRCRYPRSNARDVERAKLLSWFPVVSMNSPWHIPRTDREGNEVGENRRPNRRLIAALILAAITFSHAFGLPRLFNCRCFATSRIRLRGHSPCRLSSRQRSPWVTRIGAFATYASPISRAFCLLIGRVVGTRLLPGGSPSKPGRSSSRKTRATGKSSSATVIISSCASG